MNSDAAKKRKVADDEGGTALSSAAVGATGVEDFLIAEIMRKSGTEAAR